MRGAWRRVAPRPGLGPILLALLAGAGSPGARAQQPDPTAGSPGAVQQAVLQRIGQVEARLQTCQSGCAQLEGLLGELRLWRDELAEAEQAAAALQSQRSEALQEAQAVSQEPSELGPDEAQRIAPRDVEELEHKVRLAQLELQAGQKSVEAGRSDLTALRRRQEELIHASSQLPLAEGDRALAEERQRVAQQRRDLAGERIKLAVERLDLLHQQVATAEEQLARRGKRLSSARLAAGISAETIERSRARVEQLREEVAARAAEMEGRLGQIDEGLAASRKSLEAAELDRAAQSEAVRSGEAEPGAEQLAQAQLAEEAVTRLRSQVEALVAARELVLESRHLDEFLLALQEAQLEQNLEFNQLIGLIRDRAADVGAIEEGLARLRERLAGLRAEAQALEITSSRLRQDLQRAAEHLRHTALRLETAAAEAQRSGEEDPLLQHRVEILEALLSHQQAISESLSGRRSLIDEALGAANDQLRRYEDSVNLLETYVSGVLRFNRGTLEQAWEWLAGGLGAVMGRLRQAPAYWIELRLSLQQPERRARGIEAATVLGLAALGLLLLDLLAERVLRRWRRQLGVRPGTGWLMTGLAAAGPEAAEPGLFLTAETEARPLHRPVARGLVFVLGRLHRPLEILAWAALAWAEAPEARGWTDALLLLAMLGFVRRTGSTLVHLLVSPDPLVPSLRLWPRHALFLLRWSFWLLGLWPPLLAAYGAALVFQAPVHVRLTLGLLCLTTTLAFVLVLLVHGRARVVRLFRVHSARERPSIPVLVYNRMLGPIYFAALLGVLIIVGFFGAGYTELARWLTRSALLSAGILGGLALLVRGLHHSARRATAGNLLWGETGGVLLHLIEGFLVIGALGLILVVWGVDLRALALEIQAALQQELFTTAGGRSVRLLTVAGVLLLLVLTVWLSRRLRGILQSRVFPLLRIDRGQQLSLNLVVHYGLLVLAAMIGLNLLGIDLTTLSVVFGALSLGIGFGLQTIVNNFVSGLILLFERNVRPDDIIDFGANRFRVEEVRARCTIVTDEDNKTWILPNVRFVNETVTNWTQNGAKVRYQLFFWVLSTSDVHRLRNLVNAWAASHPDILSDPPPEMRLVDAQLGAFRCGLFFSARDTWPLSRCRSRVYFALIEMLQREGFKMPLPESRVQYQPLRPEPGPMEPFTSEAGPAEGP